MSRGSWIAVNCALMLATVLAGWFAANAPEVARPSLSVHGAVELTADAPPLPPAPYAAASSDAVKALERRGLFTAKPSASTGSPAAAPTRGAEPMARTVMIRPAEPPLRSGSVEKRAVIDPFTAALKPAKPRHEQYFGGHLISPESLSTDPDSYEQADGVAPDYAGRPRINPKRPEGATPLPTAEPAASAPTTAATPPSDGAGVETAVAPADPGASVDGAAEQGGGEQPALEQGVDGDPNDMILLGVFQSRGAERALVRTASGGNVRVRPGDEIMGWRVAAIGEDNIRLRRASQTRILRLPPDQ